MHFIVHNNNYTLQRKFQSRRGGISKNSCPDTLKEKKQLKVDERVQNIKLEQYN